ncbi:MAG: tRNA (adenosine(37)-N6)-dimethylallyltransferase MiaA [Candidatus Zhuqueibacterota bacterium]
MKKVIFIVGPTAVGKTGFSLQLAAQFESVEIISADSRQVYKLMDIGTAKPLLSERAQIVHHFIDCKLPDEYFSAGQFGNEARRVIDALFAGRKTPMVVGGSGLYIRALVDGLFERQVSSDVVKRQLKNEIREKGLPALYERLQAIDAASARQIHPNDGHRIVRALEVYELTGTPISEFYKNSTEPISFQPVFIGLNRRREELYRIIEERVDAMIRMGLVEEVAQLQQAGFGSNLNSMQTVGYREVFDYLEGRCDSDDMVRLIKQRTRNYAKRQLTWFRNDPRIKWFDIDTSEEPRRLMLRVCDYLKSEDCPCGRI